MSISVCTQFSTRNCSRSRVAVVAMYEIFVLQFLSLAKRIPKIRHSSAEGARRGWQMSKPSTLKAESWFRGQ